MCHKIIVTTIGMDQEKLFVVMCLCTFKGLQVCEGGSGLERRGGSSGNGIASSQQMCACVNESAGAFVPKNKMIPCPSRPYGTDNELIPDHSCVRFTQRAARMALVFI